MSRRPLSPAALLLGLLAGLAGFAAPATPGAADDACRTSPPYVGKPVETAAHRSARFMMVSAYHLEPYRRDYLRDVLGDLGRHRISGIVYATLGATDAFFRKKGIATTEAALNAGTFADAKAAGADVWLQVRMYDNELAVSGAAPRNVTAEGILSSPDAMAAALAALRGVVAPYAAAFPRSCTVILFEEAGIYHAPQGGGTFWSSQTEPLGGRSETWDRIFAERMVGLYRPAAALIRSIDKRCRVGIHLGHSALDDEPIMEEAFAAMDAERPDFVLYDLYLKAQRDAAAYDKVLTRRIGFLQGTLHVPTLHMAQLQTMNHFQNGFAQTPSKAEIDGMVALDEALGVGGVGFYTKNAVPTGNFGNDPLAPNSIGQATLYDSSRDRWDYGVLKLDELGGLDFRHLFDLAVEGGSPATVEAMNAASGRWDRLGSLGEAARPLTIFRGLDSRRYLRDGRSLSLRILPDEAGAAGGYAATILASEPSATFRTAASVEAEAARGAIAGARGAATLGAKGGTVALCTK